MKKFKSNTKGIKSVRTIQPEEWDGFNVRMGNVRIESRKKELNSIKSARTIIVK